MCVGTSLPAGNQHLQDSLAPSPPTPPALPRVQSFLGEIEEGSGLRAGAVGWGGGQGLAEEPTWLCSLASVAVG